MTAGARGQVSGGLVDPRAAAPRAKTLHQQRLRPTVTRLAAVLCALAFLGGCQRASNAEPEQRREALSPQVTQSISEPAPGKKEPLKTRTHHLDVTSFVTSDTHMGFDVPSAEGRNIVENPVGIERTNLRMIDSMNEAPGRDYPAALGGKIRAPRGVLITGDLTEHGGAEEWAMFDVMYGRSGKGGPLQFPVYEADGNHDRAKDWYVREQIAKRHGGRYYSFDWDDLHVVCLAEAPADDGIQFLKKDLARVAKDVPVVLYMHYPLLGPYSKTWWSKQNGPEKLERVIAGHNIVGIFHGHHHATGAYRWQGYDVYKVGSPKNSSHTYLITQVNNDKLTVAAYDYDIRDWSWWHEKPINEGTSERRSWVIDAAPGASQPIVNL